jgi:hypothetical protein
MDRFYVHKSYSARYFATTSKEVLNYVHSPSYVVVIYMLQWRPIENEIPTQWNLIGRTTTAPLLM